MIPQTTINIEEWNNYKWCLEQILSDIPPTVSQRDKIQEILLNMETLFITVNICQTK